MKKKDYKKILKVLNLIDDYSEENDVQIRSLVDEIKHSIFETNKYSFYTLSHFQKCHHKYSDTLFEIYVFTAPITSLLLILINYIILKKLFL